MSKLQSKCQIRKKLRNFLSYIDVQFSEGPNAISAKTIIDDKFNFSGWGDSTEDSALTTLLKCLSALILPLRTNMEILILMNSMV